MTIQQFNLTTQPESDPTPLYERRDSIFADDLITLALIEFDFFTWLNGETSATYEEIRQQFKLQPRGCDVLLTLLKARGLLAGQNTHRDSTVQLTTLAKEYFVKTSNWYIGPYYSMLKDRPGVADLLSVLQTNKPVFWGGKQDKKDDWHKAMQEPDYARSFTAAMDCRGVFFAKQLSDKLKNELSNVKNLLDIAGGSGIYACAIVANHPHCHAAVLEKPPVDLVVKQLVQERGFAGKVDILAGDMMTEKLPQGFDAHLWSNVLHDWDVDDVKKLLALSAESLKPGQKIIIHDAFLNEDKDGPLHAAEYSVTLAYATQGRCYGVGEMRDWLNDAGFINARYQQTAAARGVMLADRG